MIDALDRSVLLTLSYTDQFSYPLTSDEIWQRLLKPSAGGGRAQPDAVAGSVRRLQELGFLIQSDDHYALTHSQEHFVTRKKRAELSQSKWREIVPLIKLLEKIPWIQGVAVTGSLAMENVTDDDDVDFLIVTSPHSLWLVRPLVIAIAWKFGKRRSWRSEEKNSWCFNLWLETSQLSLEPARRTIYSAYEVCQAQWVFTRGQAREHFLSANVWVAKLLPNYFTRVWQGGMERVGVALRVRRASGNAWMLAILWPVTAVMNWVAYILQAWYMHAHKTKEVVGQKKAFFHPRDTRRWVQQRWLESVQRIINTRA